MPVATVRYDIPSRGIRQTRRVVTANGTPGEIAETLAEEHRCSPSDVVVIGAKVATGSPVAPVTTGSPEPPATVPEASSSSEASSSANSSSEGERGMVGPPEPSNTPSRADIHGMRKPDLYQLAARHGVPVDDDPNATELKKRLITKLHP